MNKQDKKAVAFAMFAKGHTYAEIGKAIGTSRQYAQQLTRPPIQVINALRKRAGNKCERCRIRLRKGDAHVHHVNNEITGRFDDLKRVRLLCRSCHRVENRIKEPHKLFGSMTYREIMEEEKRVRELLEEKRKARKEAERISA